MRVRQWAVIGTTLVGLFASGVGTAQAEEEQRTSLPACGLALLSEEGASESLPSCSEVDGRAVAEVGCSGPGVLDFAARGLDPHEKVRLVVEGGSSTTFFQPRNDGTLDLFGTFDADAEVVQYSLETESGDTVYADQETVDDVCSGTATLVVDGDCADPETLDLALSVEGLEPTTLYDVDYQSDGFVLNPGYSGNAIYSFSFTTDANGNADVLSKATEDEYISIVPGSFVIDFAVYADDSGVSSIEGQGTADACKPVETAPVVTPPAATTPAATTPAPVAPVVATQPAVAKPAVLANTGTPVTSVALLGGGLLAAGAGALLASRRRTN